ncbi:putative glycerol-3-phosphate acyltransferase 3 [Morella rubra]|uniref:Putative glycerol-3-phosphate acyltransferase 3 n=1 Tax=Morella rubra TaxID=262757 RepID=A0A6A1UHH8_9ROSI|nr:putative glycerol-3-phosphate acyltransferase 3 [Morella rubra]
MGLQIMVMVCFCGIKRESFRAGKIVLPKFFLEDVGSEIFAVLRSGGRKVGVSELPRVMVEGFLMDYLEIDNVIGRELKSFHGYFVGLMEEKKDVSGLEEIFEEDQVGPNMIGITGLHKVIDHHFFSHCKKQTMTIICKPICLPTKQITGYKRTRKIALKKFPASKATSMKNGNKDEDFSKAPSTSNIKVWPERSDLRARSE